MADPNPNKARNYIMYAIVALVVVLVVLSVFFVRDYRALRRAQIISAHQLWLSTFIKNHGTLTASDTTIVRPWMTFDYINKLFKVPPDYLMGRLSISDPSYPQLSLSSYAKYTHTSTPMIVSEVEGSLYNYLTATSTH